MWKLSKWSRWCFGCALVATVGCGYLQGGTWEDDPANWQKAFRSEKPEDVVVVHSRYWRGAHWSYEAAYVFEIESNPGFRQRFFAQNHFVKLDGTAASKSKRLCFADCPEWFAPKLIDEYEVWEYADEPKGNFRLLIDRTTGTMFLSDYQV